MTQPPVRLLIAGCGDLGLRVAHKILRNSQNRVWGLKRTKGTNITSAQGFNWIEADLSIPESLDVIPDDITHILFSAAPHARTELEYRAVYLNGLQNIVERALNPELKRVLFISSSAVYGEHGDGWVDEDTPVNPKHFNGRVLVETEQWLAAFGHMNAITTISLRLSGIYGPGRTTLLDKLKLGHIGAPCSDNHWANRIHVEDAAAAIVHLMKYEHPQQTYLITDSTPIPMRTLYVALAQQVGGPCPPNSETPAFVGSKRLSNARIRETGFVFQWPDCLEGYRSIIQSG